MTLLGAGMFGYSAVNSLGWPLHESPPMAVPMGLSLAGLIPLVVLATKALTK